MNPETRIALHSRNCSCRGGSWVLLEGAEDTPCAGSASDGEAPTADKVVLTLKRWRQAGKPGNLESYREARERSAAGERREYQRYPAKLEVRLARIATWRDPEVQAEETTTEAVATGGALVRSRMAVEKAEILEFAIGDEFKTRAEVMYVSSGEGPGLDGIQRLGLKFLDAPLPESFIPKNAAPLP